MRSSKERMSEANTARTVNTDDEKSSDSDDSTSEDSEPETTHDTGKKDNKGNPDSDFDPMDVDPESSDTVLDKVPRKDGHLLNVT